MSKPGVKPLPSKVKELKGGKKTYRRGGAGKKTEPQPAKSSGPPSAPRYLDKVAKKEWRRIVKELYPIGLLTKVDIVALAGYCVCYSTWIEAQGQIEKHGVLIKAPNGFPMQSPYLSIANKAMQEMRKWLVEFGMTPSSRSGLDVKPKEKEKDPLAEFMAKGGIKGVNKR